MMTLGIRAKMLLVVALFAASIIALSCAVWVTTAEKLESSDYARVVDMKDFIADVLPPRLNVAEAYTVGLELGASAGQPVDAATLRAARAKVKALRAAFEDRTQHWDRTLDAGALHDEVVVQNKRTAVGVMDIVEHDVIDAAEHANMAEMAVAITKLRAAYVVHHDEIEKIVSASESETRREIDEAAATIAGRKRQLAALAVVVLLVPVLIGFAIASGISKRLTRTVKVLEEVASGDLRMRTNIDSKDEIGAMSESLDRALDSVERALIEVRAVAANVGNASTELATRSQQFAAGAQLQAANLEETAASLEEITATVKQSSANAQQANHLATGSREVAERGGRIVTQAVRAMEEVRESSVRIGEIITAIDEIALQTNFLALNAAVEAARAGEQGRGFAVVAAEVGNLAQRSATSAKEVKELISETLGRVATSHQLVGNSGEALGEIITSVKRVTDLFGEIASSAREQSAGVDQVNEAVAQIDRVTQTTASQTSSVSRTADELSQQATQLDTLLGAFRLSTSASRAVDPKVQIRPARAATEPGQSAVPSMRRQAPSAPALARGSSPVVGDAQDEHFEVL